MNRRAYRILVIEDNPGDLRLIREAMQFYKIDYSLRHYDTADAAVQAVHDYQPAQPDVPDLILIDYNIPRGDARDVLSAISANPALSGIPAAVITSSVSPQDREQAMALGARCFIVKPARLDPFLQQVGSTISDLLGRHPDEMLTEAAPDFPAGAKP